MEYTFQATGHKNVLSKHKTTFEITTDDTLTLKGDCIIGLNSSVTLNDFPQQLKDKIRRDDTKIELILETPNATDRIFGYGSSKLSLDHPSDMVCRKSTFTCSRTLMINADKAAIDLDNDLINDLSNSTWLKVTIKVDD
ncbi:MAG: hypothetical protein BZ137_08570 [Methanosphaera sp. rholeuAM130]|nr:MAG: hypothetical protein BZ137_08570 [Methanosphaera sp. rholeuAM130]